MAKSKHSRALFEVIKQSQESATRPPPAGHPIAAWLKRRLSAGATDAEPSFRPVMREIAADAPASEPAAHATTVEAAPSADDPTEPAAARESIPRNTDDAPARRAKRVRLVLSYPSIGIAAAAGIMLMIVAFLAGRQTAPRIALTGPSLEQLQVGQPSPGVLNLGSGTTRTTLTTPGGAIPPADVVRHAVAVPDNALVPDKRRIIGRNYIIAQSYPDAENASKAAALLARHNIPATVEQIDAAPGWFCVVSEIGFDRISSQDCEQYQQLIKDLNVHVKAARLKAFEPYLYKWK